MRANQQTSTRSTGWCRLVLPFLKDITLPLGQKGVFFMPEPIQTPVPAADELAAQVLLLAQSRLTADLRFYPPPWNS